MNDWKIICNSFCDEVAASVQKNNSEKVFEEDIARELFRALDWYRFKYCFRVIKFFSGLAIRCFI